MWRLFRGCNWSILLTGGLALLFQQMFSLKLTKRSSEQDAALASEVSGL
jgi:hypothetical protein